MSTPLPDPQRREFLCSIGRYTALGSLAAVIAAAAASRLKDGANKRHCDPNDPFCCLDSESQEGAQKETVR